MKKLIVANLKMNFTKEVMANYLNQIQNRISDFYEVVICPSFIYLYMVKNTNYKLGAQNVFYVKEGAYTGEIAPLQLKSMGVSYVIVGHSERRLYLEENDFMIAKKIKAVLATNLTPILCVGETLTERELRKTMSVLKNQLLLALKDLTVEEVNDVIIAYEPVWAVGSGQTPSIMEIKETISYIEKVIKQKYGCSIKVLYGGSVNQDNIKTILELKMVSGLLIGGAALDANVFIKMLDG